MWPRAGLPMLSTKKARSRASKPAVCGQKRPARTVRVCRAAAKVRPPSEWTEWTPATRLGALRHHEHAAVGDAPPVRIRAPQAGPTRRSPNGRVSSRIGAPRPSLIRRSRIDAPQPNPRAKVGRGAPIRTAAPPPALAFRSLDGRGAARAKSRQRSPLSPSPSGRSFAPACAPAPAAFHASNGQRCRVTVPAALQARRPPFRTARDISARSTSRRTSGRIAFVVCVCVYLPQLGEKGLRRSPAILPAQKAVKSDSLDNKHRNAVPNNKILLKTHSKQSKKNVKSNPLDDERRNVLPDDRSSFRMAQQTIRHLPAESEPVRQDETQKKPKTVDRTAFRLSAPH